MDADDPTDRKRALVEAVAAARRADAPAAFEGVGRSVDYEGRTLRVKLDPDERERLEELLAEYHVFKVQQPETRKAETGVVYLSAVTDAKHAADFVEALFREVFGADEDYELQVEGPE